MRRSHLMALLVLVGIAAVCQTAQSDGVVITGTAVPVPGWVPGPGISYVNPDATKMLLAGGFPTRIMQSTFDGSQWLPRTDIGFPDWATAPTVAPDGSLYYAQNIPYNGPTDIRRANGTVWGAWTPTDLSVDIPGHPYWLHPSCFNGRDMFFNDNYSHIMVSHWNGAGFDPAEYLLPNSSYRDESAWASRDGSFMLFTSNMPGGYGGFDLYSMKWNPQLRNGTGWWDQSTITNLGSNVNTADDETGPVLAENSQRLYFSRPLSAMQIDIGAEVTGVPLPGVASAVALLGGFVLAMCRRKA